MVLLVVTILESDPPADPTDDDLQLEWNGVPVLGRPIELVGRLDEYFDFAGHQSVTLDREARSLRVCISNGTVLDPEDPRRLTFESERKHLDLGE